jgi:hypothetical protein
VEVYGTQGCFNALISKFMAYWLLHGYRVTLHEQVVKKVCKGIVFGKGTFHFSKKLYFLLPISLYQFHFFCVDKMGFQVPTRIQAEAIPVAMSGTTHVCSF